MTIPSQVLDAVLAHAREAEPLECCGILLGEGERIVSAVRARNVADDPARRFLIDPVEHMAARRTARGLGLTVVGFYNSHPHSEATPSQTDIAEASYPDAASLIVGRKGEQVEARLFRLRDSTIETLELEIQ